MLLGRKLVLRYDERIPLLMPNFGLVFTIFDSKGYGFLDRMKFSWKAVAKLK